MHPGLTSALPRVGCKLEIMTTQHSQRTLTMQPIMWSHSGDALRKTDPAFGYKVVDERGEEIAFITNTLASGRPASWQISRILNGRIGEGVGDYATAEDAFCALQKAEGVMTGSDVTLGEGSRTRAVFSCDGVSVTFYFRDASDRIAGESRTLSRADAVKVGKKIAETGLYDQEICPVQVLTADMRCFGRRLQAYGEDGK